MPEAEAGHSYRGTRAVKLGQACTKVERYEDENLVDEEQLPSSICFALKINSFPLFYNDVLLMPPC